MQSFERVQRAVPLAALLMAAGAVIAPPASGQDLDVLTWNFAAAPGQIGASVRDVETADAERAKLSPAEGAVVDRVAEGGPMAAAGIEPGDVMVEFDGERVRGARQLARLVAETPPGRTVGATVVRDGRRIQVSLTPREARTLPPFAAEWLGEIERATEGLRQFGGANRDFRFAVPAVPALPRFDFDGRGRQGRLGARVQDLTAQLAEFFGVERGVLVTEVEENTPAARAGLEAGDVVTAVQGTAVGTVADLRQRLAEVEPGGDVTIIVMRERKEVSVHVKLEDPGTRTRRRPGSQAVIPL